MTAEVTPPLSIEDRYPIPEGATGIMHELCSKGDVSGFWNAKDADDVEAARKQFAEMKKKGYVAYSVAGKDGHRDEIMKDFDPLAERIIFVKQHQGG